MKPDRPAELQVFLWMVEGNRDEDIVQAVAEHYGRKVKAAPLLKKARERLKKLSAEGPDRAWCLAAFREIYRRAIETGDLGIALRVVDKLQKWQPPPDDF